MMKTKRILAAVALVAGLTTGTVGLAQIAHGDEVTISANQQRDGWDSNEPDLSPAVVGSGTFGRLFSTAVNGQLYAQPLAVGGEVLGDLDPIAERDHQDLVIRLQEVDEVPEGGLGEQQRGFVEPLRHDVALEDVSRSMVSTEAREGATDEAIPGSQ